MWTQLRGMATTLVPDTAVGDAGDTMALLEQNTSIFNSVPGVVPFGGMMDRLYWITNSYAYTSMREISLGTYYPGVLDFTPTNVWEAIVQGYYTFSDDPLPYFAVTTTTAARSPASGSGGPMPFIPSIEFPGSQCFAGYNPTNVTGTGTIGRNSGTSGVFCSWLDFPAIFNQDCVVPGNNYLCNEAWYCTQQVNANMISTFGNAGVGASSGASGYFEAACVWEPFGNTGDGGAVFNANVNVVPKGECMLVPQGWQNEYYAASNCANAATSGGSKAVQGIPAAELVVEGLPQTTVAHRIRPFGCAGGSQANWAYGGGVFFYPQCSTNFCNCPFSFRVGDDDDDDDDSLTYGWTYDPW